VSVGNAVAEMADLAIRYCRESDGRVRAEDAVSAAAAAAGEACWAAGTSFDPDEHAFVPGQAIFSDNVNRVLFGENTDWTSFDPKSAFGILQVSLPNIGFQSGDIPELEPIVRNFAASVGDPANWGWAPLTVPQANRPRVMPLRVAFEFRSKVRQLCNLRGVSAEDRALVCVGALARVLGMTANVLAPRVALLLAFETLVGMSKIAPMTAKHLASLR
jgi:hypothetical protein